MWWEFFPTLGVKRLLGRTLSSDDDRPNAPPVAVLSYGLWQRRFGGDANTVGRIIQLGYALGLSVLTGIVVGLMPAVSLCRHGGQRAWSRSPPYVRNSRAPGW